MPKFTLLAELTEKDAVPMLIEGLLSRGGLGCIYGRAGAGKTRFAFQLACRLAAGEPFAHFHPTHPLRTLFVEADLRAGGLARIKLDALEAGLAIPAGSSVGVLEFMANEDTTLSGPVRDLVTSLLASLSPDLIIVDTIDDMASADPNDVQQVSQFLRAWLKLVGPAVATIYLRHARKRAPGEEHDSEPGLDAMFGSQAWSKRLDFAAYLSEARQRPSLVFTKVRYTGIPSSVALSRGSSTGFFEQPHEDLETAIRRVAAAFPDSSAREWAKLVQRDTDYKDRTIRKKIEALVRAGQISAPQGGQP